MRILITGSRDWDDYHAIADAIDEATRSVSGAHEVTVVHGACPTGADALAEMFADHWGFNIERHPANWALGRRAGPLRNAHMVSLGADLCLAFIRNGSRGASHTAGLAEQRGIPTRRFTSDG